MLEFNRNVHGIIHDFSVLPGLDIKKPKVGIVEETLVKFPPLVNNNIVEFLETEGVEAVMPDLMDFPLYCLYNSSFKRDNLSGKNSTAELCNMGISLLGYFRKVTRKELSASTRFTPPARIHDLASTVKGPVSLGNQTDEDWFLTGEMLELIRNGVNNIVCTQPFNYLSNHIVGRGVIREIRNAYPTSSITVVDYDPGTNEVNQLNRIKLILATVQKNLAKIDLS